MEELFKTGTIYLSIVVEGMAVIVVALAVADAFCKTLWLYAMRKHTLYSKESIRIGLGKWLSLALEFALAGDILRTAVAPTWQEIGKLAAIIVLRTTLNYFLHLEIDKAVERHGEVPEGTGHG